MASIGAYNGADPANLEEARKNFKVLYTMEVAKAFDTNCIFKDLHKVRTIDHGKSAEFYYTGTSKAHYHKKGTMILGSNNPPISSTIIEVDGLLLADVMIDNLEDAMMHFDVRQEFSHQNGEALANAYDERIARLFYLAAREASKNKDQPGGSKVVKPACDTNGAALADAIYAAAQILDEKKVPKQGRFIVIAPAQYYQLLKVKDLIDTNIGGKGSYQMANLGYVAGMPIYQSVNLPNGQKIDTKPEGEVGNYIGDFTNSVAIVGQRSAVGTVKLRDLTIKQSGHDVDVLFEGTLMTASYAMGHGILDPRCAVEIAKV